MIRDKKNQLASAFSKWAFFLILPAIGIFSFPQVTNINSAHWEATKYSGSSSDIRIRPLPSGNKMRALLHGNHFRLLPVWITIHFIIAYSTRSVVSFFNHFIPRSVKLLEAEWKNKWQGVDCDWNRLFFLLKNGIYHDPLSLANITNLEINWLSFSF